MKVADTSVLSAVEDTLVNPAVVERAIDHAIRALEGHRSEDRRETLEGQLATAEKAVRRLTDAIAEGGELEPLVDAVRAQEARRQRLLAELDELNVPTLKPKDLRLQLEGYLSDWRGLLRSNVAQGQQALRRLIDRRLTFTPVDGYYEFKGDGTVEPMLGGLVQKLVSPRGLVDLYQLEIRGETRRAA